jgi:hypothetical protein
MDSRSNVKPPKPSKVDPLKEAGFKVDRGADAGFHSTRREVQNAAERTGFEFTVVGFDD